ncbi:MAG: hypothetical protein QNK05_05895 [Myxococcota bacterium]|nr:hypothetical protein [Myxococcota bacterium]
MPTAPNLNLSREEQARREVGETDVAPGAAWLACGAFGLLLGLGVAFEIGAGDPAGLIPASLRAGGLPSECALRELDHAIETQSALATRLGRPIQAGLAALGQGNASVVNAGAGGLALRAELAHLTGPDFMDVERQRARELEAGDCSAPVHADPVAALADFAQQLREREIHLVVVPTPGKLATEPERLGAAGAGLANPGSERFQRALVEAGVDVFDPRPVLESLRESGPVFLERDSHWRPHAVEAVAAGLARHVAARLEGHPRSVFPRQREKARNVGDLAALLGARDSAESVELASLVLPGDAPAPVLLLGDSFSAIYSEREAFRRVFDPSLEWGADAGLPDQLAHALGVPVRRITRNAGGAAASRRALAVELSRGDPLAGVRVVVLQFAARELSQGSWDPVALPAAAPAASTPDAAPATSTPEAEPEGSLRVRGRIAARSTLPTPGTSPYAEAVFAVHVTGVRGVGARAAPGEIVVYLLGMQGQRLTPAARLPVGQEVHLVVEPWEAPGIQAAFGSLFRTELDDVSLLALPAYFGRVLP